MPEHILIDLLPLATGNLSHIEWIRGLGRSEADKGHKAWVVGVGTGLDWIIEGAYIIYPADPNFSDAVATALRLIETAYQPNGKKPVLLASAAFQPSCACREGDGADIFSEQQYSGWRSAELKATALAEQLSTIAHAAVPALASHIDYLTTVVNLDTRLATAIL
jgi:hypothetical protein